MLRWKPPVNAGSGLVFSWTQPTGTLSVGGNSNSIRIWDLSREQCVRVFNTGLDTCTTAIASRSISAVSKYKYVSNMCCLVSTKGNSFILCFPFLLYCNLCRTHPPTLLTGERTRVPPHQTEESHNSSYPGPSRGSLMALLQSLTSAFRRLRRWAAECIALVSTAHGSCLLICDLTASLR